MMHHLMYPKQWLYYTARNKMHFCKSLQASHVWTWCLLFRAWDLEFIWHAIHHSKIPSLWIVGDASRWRSLLLIARVSKSGRQFDIRINIYKMYNILCHIYKCITYLFYEVSTANYQQVILHSMKCARWFIPFLFSNLHLPLYLFLGMIHACYASLLTAVINKNMSTFILLAIGNRSYKYFIVHTDPI